MASTIRINVLFLGPARDLAGAESVAMDVAPATTVADLGRLLVEKFGSLRPGMKSIRIAVNESFADGGTRLKDGDEVALIPPVSGGSGDERIWVELFDAPLPFDRLRTFLTGRSALGGIVTFEGVTRAESDAEHGPLVRLDYEAYGPMAVRQMHALAEEAVARWSAGLVAMLHRIGTVPLGEASVAIAVACPHRAEAFQACAWLMDRLKQDVPIWKKDVFEYGFVRWVDPARSESPSRSG